MLLKMKFTDGYWDENGDFVEFKAEIKLPWCICSNGHLTPRRVEDVLALTATQTHKLLT